MPSSIPNQTNPENMTNTTPQQRYNLRPRCGARRQASSHQPTSAPQAVPEVVVQQEDPNVAHHAVQHTPEPSVFGAPEPKSLGTPEPIYVPDLRDHYTPEPPAPKPEPALAWQPAWEPPALPATPVGPFSPSVSTANFEDLMSREYDRVMEENEELNRRLERIEREMAALGDQVSESSKLAERARDEIRQYQSANNTTIAMIQNVLRENNLRCEQPTGQYDQSWYNNY
ncbi:hypothetical protein B0H67DRAFT_570674 [Lasiosphaeris hirsuta]|uniref:Uncharacterized protein n=1 Tax=Lasiosphaeris hirsuta TaxID=260670 RepID=A0AA40E577_9PEZI|nr:hypothetical protein B0H67DRAFT_570674 [Lasiosphaeris hirsuta]